MAKEFITGAIDTILDRFGGNSSGNAPTLLMLGAFKFSLNTAVFQQMERSTTYRWAAQQRTGQIDALQFTGFGEDSIMLPGVVYPEFKGGAGQVDDLRKLAAEGKPLRLITGTGAVLGMWVIEGVRETASEYRTDGVPRKQEFTVEIRKFSDANI